MTSATPLPGSGPSREAQRASLAHGSRLSSGDRRADADRPESSDTARIFAASVWRSPTAWLPAGTRKRLSSHGGPFSPYASRYGRQSGHRSGSILDAAQHLDRRFSRVAVGPVHALGRRLRGDRAFDFPRRVSFCFCVRPRARAAPPPQPPRSRHRGGRPRIYQGIHFQFSNEEGRWVGRRIGLEVALTRLRLGFDLYGQICRP